MDPESGIGSYYSSSATSSAGRFGMKRGSYNDVTEAEVKARAHLEEEKVRGPSKHCVLCV